MNEKEELERLKRKYSRVCDKIETLNEEAFSLEQEIIVLNDLVNKNESRTK